MPEDKPQPTLHQVRISRGQVIGFWVEEWVRATELEEWVLKRTVKRWTRKGAIAQSRLWTTDDSEITLDRRKRADID